MVLRTRLFFDAQIHSRFSRATSENMVIPVLAREARRKGLNLLGTGDFTHPLWLKEIRGQLTELPDTGLFVFQEVYFMLTGEVSTVYRWEGKTRKIHHMIHAPSFEVVEQVNEALSKNGDLESDGRPTLMMTSPELVEVVKEISREVFIYPSHAWTPWFGCYGSISGFDSIDDCYQDQVKHIRALETGMSSTPDMNWRLSSLDRLTLLSSSDAHSPWIWRIGREANVFELEDVSYWEIHRAIIEKDSSKFLFTIETPASYGKYHFTGHRACGVSLHPKQSLALNNICPKCGKKLRVGVLQRAELLSDRPEGYQPDVAIPYKVLLPLYEIISHVTGVAELYSKRVMAEQENLINKFGNELSVLLDVSKEELEKVTDLRTAKAIIDVREGLIEYVAGYDGVYGRPVFSTHKESEFTKDGTLEDAQKRGDKKTSKVENFL